MMIKAALLGVWACIVMLASDYGAQYLMERRAVRPVSETTPNFETNKTKEINVPKIKNGKIIGYIVLQVNYTIDNNLYKIKPQMIESQFTDEIFRYMFEYDEFDFENIKKIDLKKLIAILVENTNNRINAKSIVDAGIIEFTFIPSGMEKNGAK